MESRIFDFTEKLPPLSIRGPQVVTNRDHRDTPSPIPTRLHQAIFRHLAFLLDRSKGSGGIFLMLGFHAPNNRDVFHIYLAVVTLGPQRKKNRSDLLIHVAFHFYYVLGKTTL